MRRMDGRPTLDDPGLPALGTLLGEDARLVLDAAVQATGARIVECTVRQVAYRPGRSVTVEYQAVVDRHGSPRVTSSFVARSGGALPDAVALVEGDDFVVGVWRYPDDPELPGLAVVADPDGARALLDSLDAPPGPVRVRRRSYRPGRRAVLELVTPRSRVFVKVVRPDRVESLQAIHRQASTSMTIPRSLGWSAGDGIVVLEAMQGRTIRTLLEKRRGNLPSPPMLEAVLDRLPPPPGSSPAAVSPSLVARAARHAELLRTIVPDIAPRLDRVLERLPDVPADEAIPVHGDFHSAQLLVRDGRVSGLIDVDTLRMGRRQEDLGRFVAHLSALRIAGKVGSTADAYRDAVVERFGRAVAPSQLGAEVAVSLLAYAGGPFRVQEPGWWAGTTRRVDVAEEWLGIR